PAENAPSAGARGLGEATSAAGFGALLAAAALARRRGSDPTALVRIGALSLAGAAALGVILSATSAWPLALLLFAAMGFCASTAGVGFQSAVQLSIPDSHRGRVMSLWTLLGIGGAAVGAALLGLAGDLLGVRGALAALGLGGLAALSVATLARRFDAAPPPRQGAPASPRSGASD
ncbi:MAG: MFS transporter, partial [Pseudomonadota bacterium]